jgi:hypothetical protein
MPKGTPLTKRKSKAKEKSAKEAAQAKRYSEVLEYRISGMTLEEIGKRIGVSKPRAHAIVKDAIAATKSENVAEARKLEAERLDRIVFAHWQAAMQGDPKASEIVMKTMDRRAKLLGLDEPTKIAGADGGAIAVDAVIKADASFANFVGVLGQLAIDKAASSGEAGGMAGDGSTEPATAAG